MRNRDKFIGVAAVVLSAAIAAALASPASASVSIHIGADGLVVRGSTSSGGAGISDADARKIVESCVGRMKAPVDRAEQQVVRWRDTGLRLLSAYGARPPAAAKEKFVTAIADRYIRLIERVGGGTPKLVNREADACIDRLTRLNADERFIEEIDAARDAQLERLDRVKTEAILAIQEAAAEVIR